MGSGPALACLVVVPAVVATPFPPVSSATEAGRPGVRALGAAAWLAIDGILGFLLWHWWGLLLATALTSVAIRRLTFDGHSERGDPVLLTALFSAALRSGADERQVLEAISAVAPPGDAQALAAVAAQLQLGNDSVTAWRRFDGTRTRRAIAEVMIQRSATGAPGVANLESVAGQARAEARSEARQRVRRAAVMAVLPLGLCILPAFVLLVVVPSTAIWV